MKERKLRVYHSRSNKMDPCIILQGKWLADLGFSAGDYLSISCKENQVIITIQEKFQQEKQNQIVNRCHYCEEDNIRIVPKVTF